MQIDAIEVTGGLLPGQVAIELATLRVWSHVRAVTSTGTVIDATFQHGVKEHHPSDLPLTWSKKYPITAPIPQRRQLYQYLKSQEGTRYDWGWIVGYPITRRWQDADAWVCSELIASGLVYCGLVTYQEIGGWRVTPGDVAEVLEAR